jgi:hypothetical protein
MGVLEPEAQEIICFSNSDNFVPNRNWFPFSMSQQISPLMNLSIYAMRQTG